MGWGVDLPLTVPYIGHIGGGSPATDPKPHNWQPSQRRTKCPP